MTWKWEGERSTNENNCLRLISSVPTATPSSYW